MATKEEILFTIDVINEIENLTSNLKSFNLNNLIKGLNWFHQIEQSPELLGKLQNGVATMSDYTVAQLIAKRDKLNTASDWIINNL